MGTLYDLTDMAIWRDPLFWVSLGLFGWFLVSLVVGSQALGRHSSLGYLCAACLAISSWVLPLPFVEQPRFTLISFQVGGIALTMAGLGIVLPTVLVVKPFTAPDRAEPLRTTGVYGFVRHPMKFGGFLAVLGWACAWGALVGVAFAVICAVCSWLTSFLEEERLIEAYGQEYRAYQRRVPRLVPGLCRGDDSVPWRESWARRWWSRTFVRRG